MSKTYTETERSACEHKMSQAYKMMALADDDLVVCIPQLINVLIQRRELCRYARQAPAESQAMTDCLLQKKIYDDQIKQLLQI